VAVDKKGKDTNQHNQSPGWLRHRWVPKIVRGPPRSAYPIAKPTKEAMMASWLTCTAKRGGGTIHVNLENAVSVYWSERDKGTVIAFIGGEKDAVLVEERPEQILSGP
jgi:hypothetical protein